MTLLVEEPFGRFGSNNPTGHAAIYLDTVCAATPTRLRACGPGELGVVISRYHKVHHLDWVAIPLVPYLYSVETPEEVPAEVSPARVAALRDEYRRTHLEMLAPDRPDGTAPGGEWVQLVGSSFDRRIFGFRLQTAPEQDARLMEWLNDRRNVGHFNLFFHNCADFSRVLLNYDFPDMIRRNFIADFGLTTPKHAAKDVSEFGQRLPPGEFDVFLIPQVPGSVPRSRPLRGVVESLIKQKRYLVPLAVLHPELTGGLVVAYFAGGRFKMPTDAAVFRVQDQVPAIPLDVTPGMPMTLPTVTELSPDPQ